MMMITIINSNNTKKCSTRRIGKWRRWRHQRYSLSNYCANEQSCHVGSVV